ncbi:unnamed protein product [Cyprideis torosa]|uniref:Uncharacterized protein n=1 Tax=Cyprideis torosa TaxID=163714 RepID=A0A7R8ZG40_9CRUS|nr:unnamed protein product [Cyprideis torosa]CAG0880699.1 unnamed protein product [Cyprideis torosa]
MQAPLVEKHASSLGLHLATISQEGAMGPRFPVTPRPIGGKSTIAFEPSPEPPMSTPRKIKDHMKSNPLGLDVMDSSNKKMQSFHSPPRSKQGSPTPTHSSEDVSDTCSEASTSSSIGTPTKAVVNHTPRSRPPPGGYAHKLW